MNKLPLFSFLIIFCFHHELPGFASDSGSEVALYNCYYEIRQDKLYETDTIIIQINDRTGEDHCKIEIPFSKRDPIIQFSAWIEDCNGVQVRKLKKQEYTDVNAFADYSLYEDYFSRKFVLKYNAYPYRICYTYKISYRQFLYIADWQPITDNAIPTWHARLVLDSPRDYGINILQKNISSTSTIQTDDRIIRTWNATYDGSLRSEIYSPQLSDFLPSVTVVPLIFKYGCDGSLADWKSFGKWQFELNKGLRILPESEKARITSLIGHTSGKKEIVKILYHYLQDNTRYINVSLDIGGMKPYPAEYVVLNKYGDCKALTNYMKAMLDYAGIESYYTTVYAGIQPREINVEIPSQQFNHVVLAVPFEKDTLFLENTNNSNPFSYAGTFIQNRLALLVDGDRSRLVRIPSLGAPDVRESGRMEFFLDNGDNVKVTLSYDFRGYKYELYNALSTLYNKDDQNKFIHDHLPFSSFEIQDWKILKKDRDARNLTFEISLTVHNILKTLGAERYFTVKPLEIPEFTSPKARKLPVLLPYPIVLSDTVIYHVPFYFNKIIVPSDTIVKSKFGQYHVLYKHTGHEVSAVREFILHPGNIAISEYGDFYSFLVSIRKDENQKIIMQQK